MNSFLIKQLFAVLLTLFALTNITSCSLFNKNPTSVQSAEKQISRDRRKKIKLANKAQKRAHKAHWDRQTKASKKTIKRSIKARKRNESIKSKNYKYRQKHYGSSPK